jgi:hypothetical protein
MLWVAMLLERKLKQRRRFVKKKSYLAGIAR